MGGSGRRCVVGTQVINGDVMQNTDILDPAPIIRICSSEASELAVSAAAAFFAEPADVFNSAPIIQPRSSEASELAFAVRLPIGCPGVES